MRDELDEEQNLEVRHLEQVIFHFCVAGVVGFRSRNTELPESARTMLFAVEPLRLKTPRFGLILNDFKVKQHLR